MQLVFPFKDYIKLSLCLRGRFFYATIFIMRLPKLPKISHLLPHISTIFLVLVIVIGLVFGYQYYKNQQYSLSVLQAKLHQVQKELTDLKNQDQFKRNNQLQDTIKHIETTYQKAVKAYEALMDLKSQTDNTKALDKLFAESLNLLSQRNYATADATLNELNQDIAAEQQKIAQAAIPAQPNTQNAPANNTPPSNGYSRQTVTADTGTFVVDMIAADLGSTRIVVDTASDKDCNNNCPTLPLSTYVSRSGAYAGINGTFFCPAEYPSCAGKTNSFDLLVMNKNKVYFNSANNVYSINPVVVFGSGFVRFIGQASGWGRDTSVDGVISNFPLLVSGGNITYGDSSDTKFTNKGTRNFVANKGNTAYIGIMYNANMTDSAHVLKAMGMDNAMNLDEGGSTALMFGGNYIAGPGRNIPNAVLFIRK